MPTGFAFLSHNVNAAWLLLIAFSLSHTLPSAWFSFSSLPILSYSISCVFPPSTVGFPLQPSISVCLYPPHTHRQTQTHYPTHNESLINKCVSPLFPESVRTGKAIWKALQPKLCRFKNSFGHIRQRGGGDWEGGWGVGLYSWIFINRHFKHIFSWVTAGREPANQLLLRHSLSASAHQVSQVSLFYWHECWNSAARAFKYSWMKRIPKYHYYITLKITKDQCLNYLCHVQEKLMRTFSAK